MMDIIKEVKKKEYCVPEGISVDYASKRYKEVIDKGWAKYLDILSRCGSFAMNQQFVELVKLINFDNDLSSNKWEVEASIIVKELERLKFVSTDFLNNYKYIYLRNPAYTLIAGNTEHKYRAYFNKDFNSDKFIDSILKVEYFLKTGIVTNYLNMHEQLYEITKSIYKLINESDNLYNYDLETIEEILIIGEKNSDNLYNKVLNCINKKSENNSRLGIIRVLWEHLGNGYWKIGRMRETVSKFPYYLQLNLLNNGEITVHYIPEIIIFDTNKSCDYYLSRNNVFFYMFFDIAGNNTRHMAKNYTKNSILGNKHDNILGYKVKIIGFDEEDLKKKARAIDTSYMKDIYSPMVSKCEYTMLNVKKYFEKEKLNNTGLFDDYEKRIESAIEEEFNRI